MISKKKISACFIFFLLFSSCSILEPDEESEKVFDFIGQFRFSVLSPDIRVEITPNKKVAFTHSSWDVLGDRRRALVILPGAEAKYNISKEQSGDILLFGIGLWRPLGDGAWARIIVRTGAVSDTVYERYVHPSKNEHERRWIDSEIDMSRYKNKEYEIIFSVHPGPANNYDYDDMGWSSPAIIRLRK